VRGQRHAPAAPYPRERPGTILILCGGILKQKRKCHTSGFRRVADESSALLGYYAANYDDFLPTFRDKYRSQLQVSRNVGENLPLLAA